MSCIKSSPVKTTMQILDPESEITHADFVYCAAPISVIRHCRCFRFYLDLISNLQIASVGIFKKYLVSLGI